MGPALLDERLRALAHADRRLFLALCRGESRSAGELTERSRLSAATVSEHLKVLRKTGLLVLDRRGRFWFYRTDIEVLESTLREARESASDRPDRG
ncbi:MAG: ArsR/SmtB family transcription factor [Dermatophilaceae bacterium]